LIFTLTSLQRIILRERDPGQRRFGRRRRSAAATAGVPS